MGKLLSFPLAIIVMFCCLFIPACGGGGEDIPTEPAPTSQVIPEPVPEPIHEPTTPLPTPIPEPENTPAATSESTPVPTTPIPTPEPLITPIPTHDELSDIELTGATTHVSLPSQVQFRFSLRDEDGHAIIVSAEEMQEAITISEMGPATQGWEEIDYTETSLFAHTAENMPLEVIFVLDFTNSMAKISLPDGRNGISAMLDAFQSAIQAMPGAHRIGVIEFHDRSIEPALLSDLTTDRDAIRKAVSDFANSEFDPGSSRVWDSIEQASSLFTRQQGNFDASRAIVFISDGRDTSSTCTRNEIGDMLIERDIQCYAIGVGNVLEEADLADMVRATGGAYYSSREVQQLQSQFTQVVNDLRGQYMVSYTTLRRDGSYRIWVQVTLQDISDSFEIPELDVSLFHGRDTQGRISIDPPSVDSEKGEAHFYMRALHIPRNITRFRFLLDTEKDLDITIVPEADGGILEGWNIIGPDKEGYYEVSSHTPIAFGNFGLLFRITIAQITEETLKIPIVFDNAIYTGNKDFLYPSSVAVKMPISPIGHIAFASKRHGNYEIFLMNADGTEQTRLTKNSSLDYSPALSPDGNLIAFHSGRDGNYEVYVMNADGTGQMRLTQNDGVDCYPTWSPDNKYIAFASEIDGNYDIYVMNADGTEQTRLTKESAIDCYPAWSPDGRHIAFASKRDGNYELYVMNADGTGQLRLTSNPAEDSCPAWSPDGQFIAFESTRNGNYEIYLLNTEDAKQTRLTSNTSIDRFPTWSPDGQFIAFESVRDGNAAIYRMRADGTKQTRLTTNFTENNCPSWGQ